MLLDEDFPVFRRTVGLNRREKEGIYLGSRACLNRFDENTRGDYCGVGSGTLLQILHAEPDVVFEGVFVVLVCWEDQSAVDNFLSLLEACTSLVGQRHADVLFVFHVSLMMGFPILEGFGECFFVVLGQQTRDVIKEFLLFVMLLIEVFLQSGLCSGILTDNFEQQRHHSIVFYPSMDGNRREELSPETAEGIQVCQTLLHLLENASK